MVYQAHIAAGLALLALVAGTYLLTRVCHQEVCCRWFAKTVGIFVIVVSLLMLACNTYHSYLFWKGGMEPGMRGWWHGARMMEKMGSAEQMRRMMRDYPMMRMMMEEEEAETGAGKPEKPKAK